jgi:hypothetical protein
MVVAADRSRWHGPQRALAALVVASMMLGPLGVGEALARKHRRPRPSAKSKATLEIMSLTRGAKVFVDDQEVGVVPLEAPLELTPDEPHVIRLQRRGFSAFVETVRLKAGEARELEADLVPSGGVLKVKCDVRRAQILLDGKPIGVTPFDGDIIPGKHTLQIVAAGKLAETRVIEALAGEEIVIDVVLRDVPPPQVEEDESIFGRWWFWTAVGTAVVGGVTIGVLSSREINVSPSAPNHTIALP